MRKTKRVSDERPISWQTVYCSFIILIVSLFVMLCSYATPKHGKLKEIQKSFKDALTNIPIGVLFDSGAGVANPRRITQNDVYGKIIAPIQRSLRGKGFEDKVILQSTNTYVRLTILDDILFQKDPLVLSKAGRGILKAVADSIMGEQVHLQIQGHTSNMPYSIQDEKKSNWYISALKAILVYNYLHEECGIGSEYLEAVGFSQYHPFVPNNTYEEKKRNCRVEILIPADSEMLDKNETQSNKTPPSFKIWDLNG